MGEETEVGPRTFAFGEEELHVLCRKGPEECAGVTMTVQMTVEEIWDSFWNFSVSDTAATQQEEAEDSEQPGQAQEQEQQEPNAASAAGDGGRGSKEGAQPAAGPAAEKKGDRTELLGLDVWPAAMRLCEYLAANASLVAGADVAELGAGMGLPGLLCAKLGARHVLSSDYVQEVVGHLAANGVRNGLPPSSFIAMRLDWTDLSALQPQQLRSFRVVLVADVLYQNSVVKPLVGAITSLLHPQGVVLLGHLPRRAIVWDQQARIPTMIDDDEPYHIFRAAAEAAGLHARVLSDGKEQLAAGAKQRPLLLAFALDSHQLPGVPLPS